MGHRASSDARPICAHVCVCVCIHENIACTHTHYASQWADGRCRQGGPGAVCEARGDACDTRACLVQLRCCHGIPGAPPRPPPLLHSPSASCSALPDDQAADAHLLHAGKEQALRESFTWLYAGCQRDGASAAADVLCTPVCLLLSSIAVLSAQASGGSRRPSGLRRPGGTLGNIPGPAATAPCRHRTVALLVPARAVHFVRNILFPPHPCGAGRRQQSGGCSQIMTMPTRACVHTCMFPTMGFAPLPQLEVQGCCCCAPHCSAGTHCVFVCM